MEENPSSTPMVPPISESPPTQPPPRIVPPTPASAPRRGRGWMALALVLLVLLGLSTLYNLRHLMSGFVPGASGRYMQTVGPRLEETLVEDNGASAKVAVIEVQGIISSQLFEAGGFNMVEVIKAQFRRAAEDARVKAVILKVNSPGGEVLASDEISRTIADFQRKTSKPVVASMGDLAASGGYYVSAPCRWIVANELTLTGSIGVIMSSWNYRTLMDKVGIKPDVYKSGKFKDMLSPTREPDQVTPEERQMLQAVIDQTFSRFKEVVADGRQKAREMNDDEGRALNESWTELADGRIMSGKDAYQNGFVDELGSFDDAVKRARKLGGVSMSNVVKYQQRYDFSDLFRMFSSSEARTLKVDIGIERPKLQAGQLYFLAPTLIH